MEILSSYRLDVHGMVINRVVERPDSASLKELQRGQDQYIKQLVGLAGGLSVATVPLSMSEIKGKKVLQDIGSKVIRELGL
jgi:anion-transporting  ArsA/GET3 family ATPase